MSKLGDKDSKSSLYCSFCGKSQHEVRKLIAGPTVFICDECVELCKDIIHEENTSSVVESQPNTDFRSNVSIAVGVSSRPRVTFRRLVRQLRASGIRDLHLRG